MSERPLDSIDKTERGMCRMFTQIPGNGLVNVAVGTLTRHHRLCLHLREPDLTALRIPPRKPAK